MKRILPQIHRLLTQKQKTLATAESCTGGELSRLLTSLAGSSRFFILGVVAYHNRAKNEVLKIPSRLIIKNGAVSKAIASSMAQNIRRLAGSDLGLGITGIAGPTGGAPAKPVGTVFIAVSSPDKTICRKFLFSGSRAAIRKKSALKTLQLLKSFI